VLAGKFLRLKQGPPSTGGAQTSLSASATLHPPRQARGGGADTCGRRQEKSLSRHPSAVLFFGDGYAYSFQRYVTFLSRLKESLQRPLPRQPCLSCVATVRHT